MDASTEAQRFRCTLPVDAPQGMFCRRLPEGGGGLSTVQTLVLANDGRELRPLLGAEGPTSGGLRLGPPLQLWATPPPQQQQGQAAVERRPYASPQPFTDAAWDPHSCSTLLSAGHAILRLSHDNTVTLVAGSMDDAGRVDGLGSSARFDVPYWLAPDGACAVYVRDSHTRGALHRIRRVQLPATAKQQQQQTASPRAEAAADAAVGQREAVVSTVLEAAPGLVRGMVACTRSDSSSSSSASPSPGGNSGSHSSLSGNLMFATVTALYHLTLPASDATGAAAAAVVPVLLAGSEGEPGMVDGRGAGARFADIWGLALCGDGCVYVAEPQRADDAEGDEEGEERWTTRVRRVTPSGLVSTVAALQGIYTTPVILPNGCLALCGYDELLVVLDLGLQLPPGHAGLRPPTPKPAGPPPGSLGAHLGAVLRRQPDGSADVTLLVGGRAFQAHKLLLGARSDFFRRWFEGGFAESSGAGVQQLSLEDADAAAFEVVLLYIYTDAVDVPPALAQAVAELADRLLLPGLCAAAQAVVEAGITASSVVGALLWADAAGPSFSALLGRLKGWYVEHQEEVLEAEPGAVVRIAARSPELVGELVGEYIRQAAKRPRTQ